MTPRQFEGIIVNGENLADAIAYGAADKCLDFTTGAIVPARECPEEDVGEARPGLHKGKRFIRIPALDELCAEWKARYDDWEREPVEDDEKLTLQDPFAEALRKLVAPDLDATDKTADYQEWCEYLHQDLAAESTAMLWIISLRPKVMVGWHEDGLGVTRVYDPAVGKWVDEL